MENLRKRVSIELVKDADRAEKLVMKPNFADLKIFDEFLIAIKMKKTRVVMNKPIFAGMTILDLSKLLMFNFHYEYVKKKWKNVSVLYTDTDSLVLEIETEDFFADIAADVKEWFDTNDFSPEPSSCVEWNADCAGKQEKDWVDERRMLRGSDDRICCPEAETVFLPD